MFSGIKDWFKKREVEFEILNKKLEIIQRQIKPKSNTLEVMRHMLGSIDLSDHKNDKIEMSESERKEYCAAISAVFPRLEKDIKSFLYEQLHYSSNQAEIWEKVIFGRGTFNGMDILLSFWKSAHEEHLAKLKPDEKFDKHSPIAEINE